MKTATATFKTLPYCVVNVFGKNKFGDIIIRHNGEGKSTISQKRFNELFTLDK